MKKIFNFENDFTIIILKIILKDSYPIVNRF